MAGQISPRFKVNVCLLINANPFHLISLKQKVYTEFTRFDSP